MCVASGDGLARQVDNPTYVDDSPAAAATLAGLPGLLATDNAAEAIRALQRLLDEAGDRLISTADAGEGFGAGPNAGSGDSDLFVPVRDVVHRRLIESPALLERYRAVEGPAARRLLDAGDTGRAAATRLLTDAGYEATLRLAQQRVEVGAFDAAYRVLLDLESHPVRTGLAGAEAAQIAALVARYLDREGPRALAERWHDEVSASGEIDTGPIEPPPAASTRSRGPMVGSGALDASGLVPTPLHVVGMTPLTSSDPRSVRPRTTEDMRPWTMPVVVDDVVFVNDGQTIAARDRYTLIERWSATPPPTTDITDDNGVAPTLRSHQRNRIEDSTTVTVSGDLVIAATGLAISEGRMGDPRVHALDRETGRIRWSVFLPALDDRLEEAAVRGPAIVHEGVVVVAARKFLRSRRTVSVYMLGLDAYTGELRWLRVMGSIGSLPFANSAGATETAALREGVVYRADALGVITAIEAYSGRPVWVRRLGGQQRAGRGSSSPWTTAGPVFDGDSLIFLSPDRSQVLRLNAHTGELLGVRGASALGAPKYLLGVGDWLVGVGNDRVQFVPKAGFEREASRVVGWGAPLTGRVSVAGDRVAVPLPTGLALVSPERIDAPEVIELDRTGNPVTLGSQIIMAGEEELASFLIWEDAARALLARLEREPANAGPAITLADLAYRAEQVEQIVPAVDRALAALDVDPLAEGSAQTRARLFQVLHEMVEASLLARSGRGDGRPTIPSPPILADVIERMGLTVGSRDERVTQLIARGWLLEIMGKPVDAAGSYQMVLDDPALGAGTWDGPDLQVRAELEAIRRLRRLLLTFGPDVYAPFDADALVVLDSIRAGATDADALAAAARFPVSAHAPALLLEAAIRARAADDPEAETQALRTGLRSAAFSRTAGRDVDPALVGEITGRLAARLALDGRTTAAGELLREVRQTDPGVIATVDGEPLDLASLLAGSDAPAMRAAARFGTELAPVGVVVGWRVMEPVLRGVPLVDRVLMSSPDRDTVALFDAVRESDRHALAERWRLDVGPMPASLVRLERDHAIFATRGDQGIELRRVELGTGTVTWTTDPVRGVLDERVGGGDRLQDGDLPALAVTPVDMSVELSSLMLAADDATLLAVERSGRAAAFDIASGRLLWARQLSPRIVYDIDAKGGVALVAGVEFGATANTELPLIESIELRSGALRYGSGTLAERPRWVRLADGGSAAIAGLSSMLISIDLEEGRSNWELVDDAIASSDGAWILPNRIAVLGAQNALYLIALETGLADPGMVDTRGLLRARGVPELTRRGSRLVLSTSEGVVSLDADGSLAGADALGFGRLLPAVVGTEHLAVLDAMAEGTPRDGQPRTHVLTIHTISSVRAVGTGRITLAHAPSSMHALDGLLLIGAGPDTAVISAPPAALPTTPDVDNQTDAE